LLFGKDVLSQIISRLNKWTTPKAHRWMSFGIILAALILVGFYTVTDNSRLVDNHVLDSANWIGYAVCHRISDRSFTIYGRQLPLCARCTGMYLGVSLTFIAMTLTGRLRRSELPPLRIILTLLGFIGLMGIDGTNSYLHFFPNAPHVYEPRNWLRLITGMGTGLAMGLFVFPALAQTLWQKQDLRQVVSTWSEFGALLLAALVVVFLVLGNQPVILYVMALTSAAGVLIVITAIQTILVLVIFRLDRRMTSWLKAAVPLSIGLLLTIIEISAVSLLRFNLTGTLTSFPGLY